MNRITKPLYDKIKAEMKVAHNEKRRVEFHKECGFYDKEDVELLLCLIGFLFELVTLIQQVAEATKINLETREGV